MQFATRTTLTALFISTLAACGTAQQQGDTSATLAAPLRQCTGNIDGFAVAYRVYDGYTMGCFAQDGCVRSGEDDAQLVQYTAFSRGVYQHAWSMQPTQDGRVTVSLWTGNQGAGEATVFIDCDRATSNF